MIYVVIAASNSHPILFATTPIININGGKKIDNAIYAAYSSQERNQNQERNLTKKISFNYRKNTHIIISNFANQVVTKQLRS